MYRSQVLPLSPWFLSLVFTILHCISICMYLSVTWWHWHFWELQLLWPKQSLLVFTGCSDHSCRSTVNCLLLLEFQLQHIQLPASVSIVLDMISVDTRDLTGNSPPNLLPSGGLSRIVMLSSYQFQFLSSSFFSHHVRVSYVHQFHKHWGNISEHTRSWNFTSVANEEPFQSLWSQCERRS